MKDGAFMSTPQIHVEIHDLFKYNYTLRESPSPMSFSGHSHNLYEILYFIKGDATYVVEDKKYKLKSGDLIITRPQTYHFVQLDSSADYQRHNILFDHKRLGINARMLAGNLHVVNIENNGILKNIFEKFEYYSQSFGELEFLEVSKLMIQELIYNLSLIEEKEEEHKFSKINPLLSRALTYISENLFTIKDISEVADAVFVTESYLYRLFKNELFKSPKKYITEKRLLFAQNQLKKGKRPTEVSAACGFEDYTTFYRNYSELFGKTPSDEARTR